MAWSKSRLIGVVFGLIATVIGFFCLNYTNGFGLEHHTEWATQHGAPKPSYPIFVIGVLVLAFGAGIVGRFTKGR